MKSGNLIEYKILIYSKVVRQRIVFSFIIIKRALKINTKY